VAFVWFPRKGKIARENGKELCGLKPNQIFTPQAVAQRRKNIQRNTSYTQKENAYILKYFK